MVGDLFASYQQSGRRGGSSAAVNRGGDSSPELTLFKSVVTQVSTNIASSIQTPSSMRVLASYFTRKTPEIDGRPFCVALADCTFLYHLQMSRVPKPDVDIYAQLVCDVIAQLSSNEQQVHPFMTFVVRDRILGMRSDTSTKAHFVVLLPPSMFHAWDHLVSTLISHNVIPEQWVAHFHAQLGILSKSASPMVSQRAMAALVRTSLNVSFMEQVQELKAVLKAKKNTLRIDFIFTCYERLKRICPDTERATLELRGLAIHCSEIFLKFRSPIRRDYVERFLYPALCSEDMQQYVAIPQTLHHLTRRLLRQCVPNMSTTNAFYMSICALIHREMNNEVDAALEMLRLMRCQMPHAAYFLGTLAIDPNMSLNTFGKAMLVLARAAGFTLKGWSADGDQVAQNMNNNLMDVYNVLFTLREVVRYCSCGSTKRTEDMLKASRVALPEKSIDALGRLTEAFDGNYTVVLEPSLLCAELGMVVHDVNIDEAVDASILHLTEASQFCTHCAAPNSSATVCPVQGIPHLETAVAARRLLSTIAECAGSKVLEKKLIALFRESNAQHNAALHQLTFHILKHAGQHRVSLFRALEPYIRNTLLTILAADQNTRDDDNSGTLSLMKANIMHLNVKLSILMSSVIDPTYVKAVLKTFADMQLRSNHDSLVQWYLCNYLLRNGRANVELMPIDPHACNFGSEFPACAPANHVAAENGQMLLELLDRALHSSSEMAKLRGCTVCRLVQDFCPQTANIVTQLLGSCGFIPVGMSELHRYAIPVGAESTFWVFVHKQMKSCAPTRAALLATLARSIAMRFRLQSPAEAVAVEGGESTGHVFAVMMYEALRRNADLASKVMSTMSSWMSKPRKDMSAGKFTTLVYCCIQLATAVMLRHDFTDEMEAATEPPSERALFERAIRDTTSVINSQLPRVEKLIPNVAENPAFTFLLKKIHLRARLLISEVEQRPVRPSPFDDEVNEAARRSTGEPLANTVDIRDLQNEDDNDFFQGGGDDFGGGGSWENSDGDDGAMDHASDYEDDIQYRPKQTNRVYAQEDISGLSGDEGNAGDYSDGGSHRRFPDNSARAAMTTTTFSASKNDSYQQQQRPNHYNQRPQQLPQGILVNRSAASSIGPSVSMRPAAPQATSRATSVARSTQTAREIGTNTSLSSGEGEPVQQVNMPTTTTTTGDMPSSAKRRGQYFFKNTPHHPTATRHQQHQQSYPDEQMPAARSRSGVSSGASSNFLRRAPAEQEVHQGFVGMQPHQVFAVHPQHAAMLLHQQQLTPHPGYALSSEAAMQMFALQGGADSLLEDIGGSTGVAKRRTQQFLAEQQASQFIPAVGHNMPTTTNRYHSAHQTYVPPPQHAMAHITMEPRINNYGEPHSSRAPLPQSSVITHVTMQEVQSRPTSRPRDDSTHYAHDVHDDSAHKRRRLDSQHHDPMMQQYPQQQQQQHLVSSHNMVRQQGPVMSAQDAQRLIELQFGRQPSSTHTGEELMIGNGGAHVNEDEGERFRATPHPNQIGFDLTTPHASRMIPQGLVEQQAASTLRDIAAAQSSANVVMGGSSAKRRFTSQTFEGSENESQWYTVNGAPLPTYVTDSRYNMENF